MKEKFGMGQPEAARWDKVKAADALSSNTRKGIQGEERVAGGA